MDRSTRWQRTIEYLLQDPVRFAEHVIGGRIMRDYQAETMRAVMDNVWQRHGDTISFMMARQMGKNELVARLQAYLLTLFHRGGGAMVHGAPTFTPQAVNAKARLADCLKKMWTPVGYHGEGTHDLVCGRARVQFVSAERHANRVGLSAHIALFADEFQDWEQGVFEKDFAPMRSTTNATACVWGTAWQVDDPLSVQKNVNLELEQRDGRRRHFEYDWQVLAAQDPYYRAFVESEIARLGIDHPVIRTQYRLLPLGAGGRLLSAAQLAQLQGEHGVEERRTTKDEGRTLYVAGLDLAGEEEAQVPLGTEALVIADARQKRDSVVLTIGKVKPREIVQGVSEADCEIVARYEWVGVKHPALYRQILDLLHRVWSVTRVCVDATGVGAGVASFLTEALGAMTVEPCIFDSALRLHTELAFNFLAMVNSGRLREPKSEGSSQTEFGRMKDELFHLGRNEESFGSSFISPSFAWHHPSSFVWWQYEHARSEVRPGERMRIYVPESEGHDDILISTLLCARAAAAVVVAPSGMSVGETTNDERRTAKVENSRF